MPENILNKIREAYSFSKLRFLTVSTEGVSGRNAIVKTEEGKTFFIKNYKKPDAERRINSEQVEIFISEGETIPVVLPIKNKDGELHTEIDGEMYSVFTYVVHEKYSPKSLSEEIKLAETLGEMLGKIHAVSKDHQIPESIKVISSWLPEEKEKSIEDLEKIQTLIRGREMQDEYDKKALDFIELKISMLVEHELISREVTPTAVCHGDYHKGNLLFDASGKVIGVCDWDISGKSNPYLEFIRSFNMCVVRRNFSGYQDKKDFSKAFVGGYIKNCGFEFDLTELSYASELWYQNILAAVWPLSDHYYLSHTRTDSFLDSERNKILFLKDNRHSLVEHIKSCL